MIIHIKQSKLRKILDLLFTLFGWGFLALFLFQFLAHFEGKWDFNFLELNLANANSILLITILVLLASTSSLTWWSSYNKRKYGHLKRRTFPTQTSQKELGVFFQKSEEELQKLQNDRYIEA